MASLHFTPTSNLVALLSSADPQKKFNVRILSETRLSITTAMFQPVCEIDLAEEKVIAGDLPVAASSAPSPKASRKSGKYNLDAFGKEVSTHYSLKELLGAGLRALELHQPGTLAKLSTIKLTTKRIVAKDPAELFEQSHLVEQYGEKLVDGWWYGTNNSTQETNAWLKRACECAGVKWGKDFSTIMNV